MPSVEGHVTRSPAAEVVTFCWEDRRPISSSEAPRNVLRGGLRDDALRGGEGRDTLFGGRGRDALWGGPGRDTCHLQTGDVARISCEGAAAIDRA